MLKEKLTPDQIDQINFAISEYNARHEELINELTDVLKENGVPDFVTFMAPVGEIDEDGNEV